MPIIDRAEYNRAEPKSRGGGFEQMEPGVYELYIQAIRTEWDTKNGHTDGLKKKCVKVVYDVASGQFERKFSDAYFMDWDGGPNPEKDFAHSDIMSWKNLDFLKGKFRALDAANPEFDSYAAFYAIPDDAYNPAQWGAFVGKRFWAVIDGEVDLNDNGYDRWRLDIGEWITPEQARSGEHSEPKVTDNRGKARGGGAAAPALQGATYDV